MTLPVRWPPFAAHMQRAIEALADAFVATEHHEDEDFAHDVLCEVCENYDLDVQTQVDAALERKECGR